VLPELRLRRLAVETILDRLEQSSAIDFHLNLVSERLYASMLERKEAPAGRADQFDRRGMPYGLR
jgi:hypothetical protein